MVDIKWVGSPNYQAMSAGKIGAILHWMGGYLPGTDAEFAKADNIATHYGVGSPDGKGKALVVHQYVHDSDRSFGSFNRDADTRGLSIEIENDRNLPYPGKPSPAVHELVAQLLAAKAIEHDWRLPGHEKPFLVLGDFPDHRFYQKSIPQFGRDFNVTTHRSMALKDCPGTTDVEWIVNRGNEIIAEVLGLTTTEGDDVSFAEVIKHRDVEQPAGVILVDGLVVNQENAEKLDEALRLLRGLGHVKHRGVDAPTEVVEADALTVAQNTASRVDGIETLLKAIADKLGI